MRRHPERRQGRRRREDSLSLQLLTDIKALWPGEQDEVATKILIESLNALEDSPWSGYGLSPHKVAKMLRDFEVTPRTVRIGKGEKGTARGYVR